MDRNHLPADRVQRLEALGFDWDPATRVRGKRCSRASSNIRKRRGHCNVPRNAGEGDDPLANWVHTQRQFRSRGQLTADRVRRLDALGFDWDPLSARTEEMFARLVEYKKLHGDCNVPRAGSDYQLWQWVANQRQFRRRDTLPPDRLQRLETLGFEWDPHAASWEKMFERFTGYKQRGDGNVPQDRQLARWIVDQRRLRTRGRLSEDRIRRLDELGFEWEPDAAKWDEMFERLAVYKMQNATCAVPLKWAKDPELGRWVNRQRSHKKRRLLSEDQLRRLNALGFACEPKSAFWEEMFMRLVAFRARAGHCNVSKRSRDHPQLATWVDTQRQIRKRGRLLEERIRRLDELGFEWERKRH